MSADGVEVVVPRRMALRHVTPFVEQKRPWIERTLRRIREAEEAAAVRLSDGGSVPYLGRDLTLRVRVEPGRVRSHVALRGDVLCRGRGLAGRRPRCATPWKAGTGAAPGPRWHRGSTPPAPAPARATRGCRSAAQRTRWASCSSNGAMSFNWRLLLAPPEILDYVVEHEVAHLEVLDHSPRFWRLLVERSLPGLPRARALAAALRLHASPVRAARGYSQRK